MGESRKLPDRHRDDALAGFVALGGAVAPQHTAVREVRVNRVPEPDAPAVGSAMQAPPTVILTADGTRSRCGRCGTVLVIAEVGALKGFVIHCCRCDHYNEVPL